MYTKRNLISAILAVGMLLAVASVTQAASEAEKQLAIDAGLAWLAGQQNGDGSWTYGGSPDTDVAATGAALLAFIEEAHTPTSATAYSGNVVSGLNYLFANAQIVDITVPVTPAGDPDTNGNLIGVKFVLGGNNHRDIYTTGLALLPIAAVGAGTVAVAGSQVDGWSYADVIQDTVDYLAYAQNEGEWPRGGWRYYANYGSSDNSNSQWPVVALLYAQSAGATVPAFVATELDFWVNYIQNQADGGSYYDNNFVGWGSNVSRTGTLLIQQVFSGVNAGMGAALNYLNIQWLSTASGWNGNFGHPYAMWAAYKGLQVTIGLDDETTITNLHPDPLNVDNPNHDYNWWEDYCEYLVNTQVGGTWPGYSNWTGPLATAWYINILAATEIPPPHIEVAIDIKPTSCPNPVNLKSKGVLPVAVLGNDEFDVTLIDPATVVLSREGIVDENGEPIIVPPLRWAYEDVATPFEGELCDCHTLGADGYLDLTLKFSIPELVDKLNLNDVAGGTIPLTLTGNLIEGFGTPIRGEDCVWVLREKGK